MPRGSQRRLPKATSAFDQAAKSGLVGSCLSAHVRPLGSPNDGPDVSGNVLCLCPNHHVLFDKGTIWIDSSKMVQPLGTLLRRPDVHPLDLQHAAYHAGHFGKQ
jgi:putative restriction endonuclease